MNAAVYYFSGTGNSYIVARNIADRIHAGIHSIPAYIHSKKVTIPEKVAGFVFPDYHSSLPNIIKRFINVIDTVKEKYIFGVCTYGGAGPGLTIKYLDQLIKAKGGKLAGGFAVKMPYNYIVPVFSFKTFSFTMTLKNISDNEQQKMFSDWDKKLVTIVDFINNRKSGVYETSSELLLTLIDAIKLKDSFGKSFWLKQAGFTGHTASSFAESWQLMDYGFFSDENCIGCRTCKRVCPVDNIEMITRKPSWKHNCEQCFACLQWCPQSAIQFGRNMKDNIRYHHPDVKAADLIV